VDFYNEKKNVQDLLKVEYSIIRGLPNPRSTIHTRNTK